MKRRKPHERSGRAVPILLLAVGVLVLTSGWLAGFREDELECEQAVAKLVECCPDFSTNVIECNYATGCGSTTYPALSIDQSQCIGDLSCSEIVANKICERARFVDPVVVGEDGGIVNGAEVCP